ncbi:uncharacterized protein LOC117118519 [Anneissia japonica]|uniref:uncharacterized protein LOC117118519 n=1 Tax=Anneissia japonica TaxID=1529436 RepID=UPI00142576FA|nr:uncharacterized protein LOC117118519 [Anneissia japonica]XP_033119035.1 uncharacterized protein LOC117118519 [Anneissia japonica]
MFSIRNRLVQAEHVSSPKVHSEEAHVQTGRDAEKSLLCALEKRGVNRSDIFCGLRVPDDFQMRKHEIDLVVLTGNGIYVIEVKNWSGTVTVSKDGKSWIQRKSERSSEHASIEYDLKHDNVLEQQRLRANLLRNHLIRKDICLPMKVFRPYVVFMNDRIKLPDDLASMKEIILPERYTQFLESFQFTYLSSIRDALVPGFISGQLSYSSMESTRAVLKSIGTWDVIQLNGGKQLIGDFKSCSQISPNRQETEKLQFVHQRNAITATLWAILGYTPQVSVSMLQRGGTGWIWNASNGSINIPYNMSITFRIAGEELDSQIPANEIDYIQISI